jgi:rhamnosyltransferase subunit B
LKKVVIATLGSLGDLHPFLSIGKALQDDGHAVIVAANPIYQSVIESHQLTFARLGTAQDPMAVPGPSLDPTLAFIDHVNFSQLETLLQDLMRSASAADLIVAPYYVVPAHLVAECRGIPFVGCALSPAHLAPKPGARAATDMQIRLKPPARWHAALTQARAQLGLPRKILPYAEIMNAPAAILGLFPQFLLHCAASHFARLRVVGYPFLSSRNAGADAELVEFCAGGAIVVSFGSHIDRQRADFLFRESVAACRSLGMKSLYLSQFVSQPRDLAGEPDVLVRPYIDHDVVFPLAAMVVHHGGIGTLMHACKHQVPMVIVPFQYDQPYHAARMAQLVNAPFVPAGDFSRDELCRGLQRAQAGSRQMRRALAELRADVPNGARQAAREITSVMNNDDRNTSSTSI